jgi:hypothetical protein
LIAVDVRELDGAPIGRAGIPAEVVAEIESIKVAPRVTGQQVRGIAEPVIAQIDDLQIAQDSLRIAPAYVGKSVVIDVDHADGVVIRRIGPPSQILSIAEIA